nr:hypothetical protein [uncultured Prevotella sp.]
MKKEISIAPLLKEMKIDETISFPIKKFSSVKNACSNYALRYERKFSTQLNRKMGVIKVTRIF